MAPPFAYAQQQFQQQGAAPAVPPAPPQQTSVVAQAAAPSLVVSTSESSGLANVPMNVFVGKLPLDVDDTFVANLLKQCGTVLKWKRTMDSETDKPKAFGFCTFANAHGAMQAVRVLNDFAILEGHKILVKVGKKEQAIIDSLRAPRGTHLVPSELELLEKLRRLVATTDPRSPIADDDAPAQSSTIVSANGDEAMDPAILEEMAKFRSKQAQRDRELEDERRRKLQAKIQESKRGASETTPKDQPKRQKTMAAEQPQRLVVAHEQPTTLAPTTAKLGFGIASAKPKKTATPPALFAAAQDSPAPRPLQKLDDDDDEEDEATRDHIERARAAADKIPSDKDALFALPIDWHTIEKHKIVRTKLRPWIAKRIHEYLGEEEQTLIDFVATQLDNRADPHSIVNELALVLEDDAHTFVFKLWRVLHFHAASPED